MFFRSPNKNAREEISPLVRIAFLKGTRKSPKPAAEYDLFKAVTVLPCF